MTTLDKDITFEQTKVIWEKVLNTSKQTRMWNVNITQSGEMSKSWSYRKTAPLRVAKKTLNKTSKKPKI